MTIDGDSSVSLTHKLTLFIRQSIKYKFYSITLQTKDSFLVDSVTNCMSDVRKVQIRSDIKYIPVERKSLYHRYILYKHWQLRSQGSGRLHFCSRLKSFIQCLWSSRHVEREGVREKDSCEQEGTNRLAPSTSLGKRSTHRRRTCRPRPLIYKWCTRVPYLSLFSLSSSTSLLFQFPLFSVNCFYTLNISVYLLSVLAIYVSTYLTFPPTHPSMDQALNGLLYLKLLLLLLLLL